MLGRGRIARDDSLSQRGRPGAIVREPEHGCPRTRVGVRRRSRDVRRRAKGGGDEPLLIRWVLVDERVDLEGGEGLEG
jgi:hypothetical protein